MAILKSGFLSQDYLTSSSNYYLHSDFPICVTFSKMSRISRMTQQHTWVLYVNLCSIPCHHACSFCAFPPKRSAHSPEHKTKNKNKNKIKNKIIAGCICWWKSSCLTLWFPAYCQTLFFKNFISQTCQRPIFSPHPWLVISTFRVIVSTKSMWAGNNSQEGALEVFITGVGRPKDLL